MMLLRSEKYTDENGNERVKDFFGKIVDSVEVITSTHDRPVECEIVEEPETMPQETQMDRIEKLLETLVGFLKIGGGN